MRERHLSTVIGMGLTMGAGLGVSLGAAVGAAMGDPGKWIALGSSIGAAIGLSLGMVYASNRPQRTRGVCPSCGYSTKGLRGPICPECGADRSQRAPS